MLVELNAANGVQTSGGVVTQWNNLATNANAGTSATFNTAAIYTGNFVNSAPTYSSGQVNFNGSQGLAISVSAGQFASGYTVFVVAQATGASPSGFTGLVSRGYYDSPYGSPWDMFNNSVVVGVAGGTGQSIAAMTSQSVLELTGNSANLKEYVNGTQKMSYNPSAGAYDDTGNYIYLGTRGDGYTSFVGNMEEVLVYAGSMTAAQSSSVESYLAQAWLNGGSGGAGGQLPTTTPVTISANSTLDLAGQNQTVAGLSGGGTAGGATTYGTVTNSGANDSILTVAGTSEFDGVLADGTTNKLGLTVSGGSLTLAGPNTFTGPTTVNGGTLQIGNGTSGEALASPTISNSGALVFNHADSLTYAGAINGPGSLTKLGGGTLALTGNNGYSGATTVNAGMLQMNSANALPAASSIAANGGVLDLGGNAFAQTGASIAFSGGVVQNGSLSYAGTYTASAGTVSANLNGAAGLTMAGPGTLVLAGSNNYNGNTNVNSGTLVVNGSLGQFNQLNLSAVLSGSGTVGNVSAYPGSTVAPGYASGGTLTATTLYLNPNMTLDFTLSPTAVNTAFLNVTGPGYLTLPSSGGTLNIFDGGGLSAGTYALMQFPTNGLSGTLGSAFSTVNLPSGLAAAGDVPSLTTSGNVIDLVISASGSLINGQWQSTSGGSWSTAGNWSGGIPGNPQDTAVFGASVTSGTASVTLDSSRSLSSLAFSNTAASYTINAAGTSTLTLADTATGTAALSNSGGNHTINAPIVLGSNLNVTATTGSALTIAGGISESSPSTSLSVSGGGEVILSGTDTYTGGTNVSAATLAITSASALSSTGVVTIGGGGQLVLGSGSGIGALLTASAPISSGAVALSAAAAIPATLAPIGNSVENMATLGGAPSLSQGGGGSAVGVTAAAVPEPGTLALLAVAVGGLLACARRRRQSR